MNDTAAERSPVFHWDLGLQIEWRYAMFFRNLRENKSDVWKDL